MWGRHLTFKSKCMQTNDIVLKALPSYSKEYRYPSNYTCFISGGFEQLNFLGLDSLESCLFSFEKTWLAFLPVTRIKLFLRFARKV